MTDEKFRDHCDLDRSSHLWVKFNSEWKLRHTVNKVGVADLQEVGI